MFENVNLGETEIVQAISRILGLWAYERLEDELRNIFQSTNRQMNSDGSVEAEEKLNDVRAEIQKVVNGRLKTCENKRSNLIERQQEAESKLADIEDQLKTLGAVDPQKLEHDQLRRDEVAVAKREIEGKLENAWETPIPVTLLAGLRTAVTRQMEGEERLRQWSDRKAAIEPKLPSIKASVFDELIPEYSSVNWKFKEHRPKQN